MAAKQGEEGWVTISRRNIGPTFGKAQYLDLHIADHCNTNTNSYSNLGGTYELPAGYTYDTDEAQSLLAGSFKFKCDDYEVFIQQ